MPSVLGENMVSEEIKKMPVGSLFKNSWVFVLENLRMLVVFALINYLTIIAAVYTWQTIIFLPLMAGVYVFWCYFFRWYFNRKPFLDWGVILHSTVPSTKVVVLSVIVVTALIVLPVIPLFLGLSGEFFDRYQLFLQEYMQESQVMNLAVSIVVTLLSPVIFYRPFLAWISALLGRSGSIRSAWRKTEYNYWQFLSVALIFNLGFVFVEQTARFFEAPLFVMLLVLSPLILYFNIVLAKSYEYFFLE